MDGLSKNDNYFLRELIYKEPDKARFIPIAQYLIKKHCSEEWKHDSNDSWHITMEYDICNTLSSKVFPRDLKIDFIAISLKCNPILLHNDPDLPF